MSPKNVQPAPTRASPQSTRSGQASGGPPLDYGLVVILATMLALGLIAVLSASLVEMGIRFFLKQLAAVVLGVCVMLVMSRIPYRWWQRIAVPILLLALALLIAVLVFTPKRLGAQRTLGNFFQPSEFSKLAVVIYISAWVAAKGNQVKRFQDGLLPFVILMGAVTLLLVLEPSLSVAIIILLIGVTIFFVGGADIKQLLALGALGAGVFLVVIRRYPHASDRVNAWLDPSLAAFDARTVWQNGLLGQGPFLERVVQRTPVPLPYNDYLFAHIGHMAGILGALLVVALFAALGYKCLGIALNAPDKFGTLMGVGITTWILVQAAIHIGSSMSLIPQTGQPLPFMSQGGSAMVACLAGMGLMMSIWRASPEKKALHASDAIRWRDWWPRVPSAGRGERAASSGTRRAGSVARRRAKRQAAFAFGIQLVRRRNEGQDKPRPGQARGRSDRPTGKTAPRSSRTRSGDRSRR